MTVTLPNPYGKADWTDYVDYWRDADATWIQDRLVIRVADNAGRDALGNTPGGVVYNAAKDALELRRAAGGYQTITPLPAMLAVNEDTANNRTTISHTAAGGKGIVYTATDVQVTNPLNVMNGVLTVDATGASFKTGAKTAKLTTDAANLVSDSPVSAPSLVLTGTGTVLDATNKAVVVGPLTAGAVTAASGTVSGAWNAGSGTIGGVALASNKAVASSGYDSQSGSFYGDANSAIMRHVNRSGPYVQVTTGGQVLSGGGYTDLYSQVRVMGAAAFIQHYNTGKNIAPSFYSASDPGVGNYPEGTIWIN